MIDRTTALEIARKRAEENNWAFAEPVSFVHRRSWFGKADRYEIETNAGNKQLHIHFVDAALDS